MPFAGGRAHQGERRQVERERLRRGPLAELDGDAEILHRAVEVFFDDTFQAVDLIDKQHRTGRDRGQHARQIAGLFQHWAGGFLDFGPHLGGEDVRESCFAEPRWAREQHVIELFVAQLGGLDGETEIVRHRQLTGEVAQAFWPQGAIAGGVRSIIKRLESTRWRHGDILSAASAPDPSTPTAAGRQESAR